MINEEVLQQHLNTLLLWSKVAPRSIISFHTGKYQQYDKTMYSQSWHLWSFNVWAIKLVLKTRYRFKLIITLLHFALPSFTLLPWKRYAYNQKTSHRSQKAHGNIFYMTFLPSKVESQSENETDMYYLPITLIYGAPSIVKHMNVFAEQVNKNAIIKHNTTLKIISFILTTSSFRLPSIPVERLRLCNFNYFISKLVPDGIKGCHSFQNRIKQ